MPEPLETSPSCPSEAAGDLLYRQWPALPELFPFSLSGLDLKHEADLEDNPQFIFVGPAAKRRAPARAVDAVGASDLLGLQTLPRGACIFPLYLRDETKTNLFAEEGQQSRVPNLNPWARRYLDRLTQDGLGPVGPGREGEDAAVLEQSARALFHHAVAITRAPLYRAGHEAALKKEWPRLPLPATAQLLAASSKLGAEVTSLLDLKSEVPGVTSAPLRSDLRSLAKLVKADGGIINPLAGHLLMGAPWGERNATGQVAPSAGQSVVRAWNPDELAGLAPLVATQGIGQSQALALLGEEMHDIHLNPLVLWKGVPRGVWEYAVGGQPVLHIWLSHRAAGVTGRALTIEETREMQGIVRRIAALLLLGPSLDANYRACTYEAVTLSSF